GDPEWLVDCYIDAINAAVRDCGDGLIIGVHMCRGNFRGRYLGIGSYESIAERFLARTNVNHFLLEYDTPRAGDFAPLRCARREKAVGRGLTRRKTPALENMETLERRGEGAAKSIELDRRAISPQCGFASPAAGNPLSEADQRAKLQLAVDAARA